MKRNRAFRCFAAVFLALFCMAATPTVAFAGGGDGEPYYTGEETTGGYEPQPLTPEGNMTLVDDIAGESAGDKQFITVVTKGGNYFCARKLVDKFFFIKKRLVKHRRNKPLRQQILHAVRHLLAAVLRKIALQTRVQLVLIKRRL